MEKQLQILSKNIPTIKTIRLIGGEPLLHPDLKEICLAVRRVFSKKDV
jgi:molybdenum cofactor biosynthesis enzyme MoaA